MRATDTLFAALDELVLERLPSGRVVPHVPPPEWSAKLGIDWARRERAVDIADISPFLEDFLPEAERVWSGALDCADSGPWTELVAGGEELHLEAAALRVAGSRFLVLTRCDALFRERERVLQRARELRLAHDALASEVERKDVLVHCVVHDLGGALNSMLGALSLLEEKPSPEACVRLVQVALGGAIRQRDLIREILDVFAAERGFDGPEGGLGAPPDLRAAVSQVVEALAPLAATRGVHLSGPSPAESACDVVGEERRLVRVLFNLIENAIRFTPSGRSVRVALDTESDRPRVTVEDEGSGVAPGVVPRLFQKLSPGREAASGIGLGLYFCRITVESWGGAIGYDPRAEGGARFWFWLRRPIGVASSRGDEQRGVGVDGEAAVGGR